MRSRYQKVQVKGARTRQIAGMDIIKLIVARANAGFVIAQSELQRTVLLIAICKNSDCT